MAKQDRKMPSSNIVKRYWASYLIRIGKFDSLDEIMNNDICFACGWQKRLARCHITARMINLDDSESNLHLLCRHCHNESEMLGNNINDRSDYWEWFCGMHQLKRIMNSANATYIADLMVEEKVNHNDVVLFSRSIHETSRAQTYINPDTWDMNTKLVLNDKRKAAIKAKIEKAQIKAQKAKEEVLRANQLLQLSLFA